MPAQGSRRIVREGTGQKVTHGVIDTPIGVFGGRDGYGFDGTSPDLPATGGSRTDRNVIDSDENNGYWDGISNKDTCILPLTERGECVKDRAHSTVRAMLKDTVPEVWSFTEDEIDAYLETSLLDFNSHPTFTCFHWNDLDISFLHVITLGAVVFALFAQGLLEAGREFTINDNGISFTPPQISNRLSTTAQIYLQQYAELKEKIKANIKPNPRGLGMFRVLNIQPALQRLRHLRERQLI